MSRSPAKRVDMCFDMSSAARAIVRKKLQDAGLRGESLAEAFATRLYGQALSQAAVRARQKRTAR